MSKNYQPISEFHAELGSKISQYQIDHNLNLMELSKKIGIHHVKLARARYGTQNLTLSEYLKIKEVLG